MSILKRHEPRDSAVTLKTDGNPEGKGLNGFLLDWYKTEPRGVVARSQRQVLAEFFTSMLVLSAKFKYEPVIGSPNYLYWIKGEWSLSLIGPHEWSDERRAGFAGTCVLQRDMTWTIEPSKLLSEKNPVSDAVGRSYDAFNEMLGTDLTLEEILPFYVGSMHYYPRLLASALARSVRGAVTLGDQRFIPCRNWRLALPRLERMLLSQQNT
jgi:hypothetical protein